MCVCVCVCVCQTGEDKVIEFIRELEEFSVSSMDN